MKQKLPILLVFIISVTSVCAQELVEPNKPYAYLDSAPGYITINDLTCGFSPGDVSLPYSKSYFGFTTIHGYQITKNFIAAAGTGASFFESGMIVPLFLHIRCNFNIHPIAPFIFAEGGLLFGSGAAATLFINPGAGIRYSVNHKLGINFGTGLFIISGIAPESFISLRLGITFKPRGAV